MATKKSSHSPTDSDLPSAPAAAKKAVAKKTAVKKAAAKKAVEKLPAVKKVAAKSAGVPQVRSAGALRSGAESGPAVRPSPDAIARAAYLNYLRRLDLGLPGDPRSDWLEAERQLGIF